MNNAELIILIVQIILILALSRLVGMLFARIGQPQVIGEMAAGIMLGPSLLGLVWPSAYQELFPAESIHYLQLFSEFGVIFFLFLMGLELDPQLLRRQGKTALAISIASIATPFALGVGVTAVVYSRLFNDAGRVHFAATALFVGAAISVTAFPVLARILSERNLHRSHIGAICIAGAAMNDVIAWCMLAFVVAIAQYDAHKGPMTAAWTAIFAGGYIAFMLLVIKPFLVRLQRIYDRQGHLSQNVMAVVFLLVLASAYTTEKIGIHALFGAFVMGCVMPKGSRFVRDLNEKLEDYTVVFLLPLFFAYAGLSTDLTRIFASHLWNYAGLFIVVACVGKIGGSALAARLCGQTWRESGAIGVLMNTRGLMELIILSIGLSLGVINQNVYALLVVMTLVTTMMTTPLLAIVYPEEELRAQPAGPTPGRKLFSILIPISDPRSGLPLVRLAAAIGGPAEGRKLLALHLRRPEERDAVEGALGESQRMDAALEPIIETVAADKAEKIDVEPISFVSNDISEEIASIARLRQANLVLMGFHRPVFGRALLGGRVREVLVDVPADVAIFINRGLDKPARVMVPYLGSIHDRLALEIAQRLATHAGAIVTVLHVVAPRRSAQAGAIGVKAEIDRVFHEPDQKSPVEFKVVEDTSPVEAVLRESANVDLVLIGLGEDWGLESQRLGFRHQRIALECPASILIVRKFARGIAAKSS